jgi:hypothetical protein
VLEQVGDKLGIVERQVTSDLERFKKLIEDQGYASGAWRGAINEDSNVGTPGVESAVLSEGDSGKAGVSAKAVIAGAAVAAGGLAAAAALSGSKDESEDQPASPTPVATPLPPTTDRVEDPVVVAPVTADDVVVVVDDDSSPQRPL